MATTTIDNETELSAVNSILGAIGQSPVTTLGTITTGTSTYDNPEIAFIYNLLRDANVDVQNEGWHFNKEDNIKYTPDSNGKIGIGDDILQMDVTKGWSERHYDVVRRETTNTSNNKREAFLYDKLDHTFDWSDVDSIYLDVTKLLPFEDLPSTFRRYITAKAATTAATQLVGNPQLVQLLNQQEAQLRATCVEYECNQSNNTMFDLPDDSTYRAYTPWRSLRR